LSLAYAETHPDRCIALILRGIFLCRKSKLDWFYSGVGTRGTRDPPSSLLHTDRGVIPIVAFEEYFPEEWYAFTFPLLSLDETRRREAFESLIPPSDRSDMIGSYYKLITSEDDAVSLKAAEEWTRWESSVSHLYPEPEQRAKVDVALKWAR